MQPFDYVLPKDLADASTILATGNGAVRPLQGGTDLLIRIRNGQSRPERVLDLKGLPGMQAIETSADGWLVIGAACTMNQVARTPAVRDRYPLLAEACNSVASYQLRNRATVGGNCCNASPAADTAPALYCLGAVMELYGPNGFRRTAIADFFLGPGRAALEAGEFLTSIHLPPAPRRAAGAFLKLGRTTLGDISTVSVAVHAWLAAGHMEWRITLGAVGPTPLRAPEAEAALSEDSSPAGVRHASELAAKAARPIDDLRASAAYRRAMVQVLTRRGIEATLASLGGAR